MGLRGTSGYATLYDPDFRGGHPKEADTFTCAHCNRIIHVKPKAPLEDLGGRCNMCDDLICPDCVRTGQCDPFEEKLKRMEAVKSYG
jgi:hypothetical protein